VTRATRLIGRDRVVVQDPDCACHSAPRSRFTGPSCPGTRTLHCLIRQVEPAATGSTPRSYTMVYPRSPRSCAGIHRVSSRRRGSGIEEVQSTGGCIPQSPASLSLHLWPTVALSRANCSRHRWRSTDSPASDRHCPGYPTVHLRWSGRCERCWLGQPCRRGTRPSVWRRAVLAAYNVFVGKLSSNEYDPGADKRQFAQPQPFFQAHKARSKHRIAGSTKWKPAIPFLRKDGKAPA